MADAPKKLGRASEWNEKYCKQLIDHMGRGLSFESFSAVIGVARSTIYKWTEEYPSFMDAKRIGIDKNLLWWETQGIEGLWVHKDFDENGRQKSSKTLNTVNFIFQMKNRHKWKDKNDDPEPQTQRATVDLSNEELEKELEKNNG